MLPLTRNSGGSIFGPQSPRSVLRIREKYLLFAVIIMFVVFTVIGISYLPELKTSKVYINYLKPSDSLGPNLLGLVPPPAKRDEIVQSEYAVLPPPRARIEDELRLEQKINEHFNLSQEAVIPRPNLNPVESHVEIASEKTSASHYNWNVVDLPDGKDSDPEIAKRRDVVKKIMITAWDNYKKYAWGDNELKPISKKGHSAGIFGKTKLGATIVDGLDTLWIMGLKNRFKDGRDWVDQNLDFSNIKSEMSLFETIIRFVGGLLSCYAFTKDEMFLRKAIKISDKMLPAFDTPTGLPHSLIIPATGASRNYVWASQGNSILAEVGTLSLEFAYLTALTNNHTYFDKIDRVRTLLDSLEKPHGGLYPNYINAKTGKFGLQHTSIGALGDSFYEYLLKLWIMMDKKDTTAHRMYNEAIEAIDHSLVKKSSSGLVYVADMRYGRLEHKMGHLACFCAGMFALGGYESAHSETRNKYFIQLGADVANTCHESYARTKTKLGPEVFYFTGELDAQIGKKSEQYYILRPEVIEGWFYMWRVTKDRKYRDWAWEAVQAIEKHCLVPDGDGYSGISNVDDDQSKQDDVQQSFFLAETLKYLYLIFSSDELLPLDQWVFNTEAHPFPIKRHNPAFPV